MGHFKYNVRYVWSKSLALTYIFHGYMGYYVNVVLIVNWEAVVTYTAVCCISIL